MHSTRADGGASRERIMAAAAGLFAKQGFAGTSIRRIAREAGLNSSLISYYFGGKKGLYKAMLDGVFEPELALLRTEAERAGAADALRRFANAIAKAHRERPEPLLILHRELNEPSFHFETLATETVPRILGGVASVFAGGAASGEFRRDVKPLHAAMAFMSILNFYFGVRPLRERAFGDGEDRDREFIDDAMRIFFRGIAANDGMRDEP